MKTHKGIDTTTSNPDMIPFAYCDEISWKDLADQIIARLGAGDLNFSSPPITADMLSLLLILCRGPNDNQGSYRATPRPGKPSNVNHGPGSWRCGSHVFDHFEF